MALKERTHYASVSSVDAAARLPRGEGEPFASKVHDATVAVVSGSNIGLGFAVAEELLLKGCHVVLAVRNAEKGRHAAKRLEEATGRLPDVLPSRPSILTICSDSFVPR